VTFVIQYLRTHKAMLLATTALSGANAALTLLLLRLIQGFATAGQGGERQRFLAMGAGLMGALLLTGVGSQYLVSRMGAGAVAQLRADLSRRFLDLEYERLLSRKHVVFGALIEDITRIGPLVLLAPQAVYNVLLVLLCCAYLVHISAALFAVFAILLGLTLAVTLAVNFAASKRFDDMRAADEGFFEQVRTISEAKKQLTLNPTRTGHFVDKLLRPAVRQAETTMVRAHLLLGLNEAWSAVMVLGAAFLVACLGQVVFGLPPDTILQFVVVGLFLAGPVNFIVHAGPLVSLGLASLRHLERVGLAPDEAAPERATRSAVEAAPAPAPAAWKRIRAEGVCYTYPAEGEGAGEGAAEGAGEGAGEGADDGSPRFALGPVDVELRQGELLFIVGDNGSGKSTLLLLLCGLLRPSAGKVSIDGRPVQGELGAYRARFGGVFGDFFLFSHVLDAQGELLPDARVNALLEELALTGHTSVRKGELSRLNLSTGQRKRLAMLQCHAEDREIYFFDEWTADQDPDYRRHFYRVLLPELKRRGKTVVVITHDDRYFDVADRVLTLERGRVAADSSRQALPSIATGA
jgi:putative ATP-binding cassette transporter